MRQRQRDREGEKKCSEIIVLLSVVQECGLKGKKRSILAENHILIGSVKFRKGMLDSLFSGVCHRLLGNKIVKLELFKSLQTVGFGKQTLVKNGDRISIF